MIYRLTRLSIKLSLIATLSLWGYSLEAQNVYRGSGGSKVQGFEGQIRSFHSQRRTNSSEYLQTLYSLGVAYSDAGKHIQARDSLAKAVELKISLSGKRDTVYTNIISDYANSLIETGAFDPAKNHLLEALRLNKEIHGEMSVPVIRSVNNLAALFEQVGLNVQSHDLYKTALTIARQIKSSDDHLVAECLSKVGSSYFKNGDLELALSHINKALEIFAKKYNHTSDIEYIEALEAEGMVYEVMGQLDKSEKILLRTYELKQQIPDINPVLIIETLNDLGILYRDLGNHKKSAEYFQIARDQASRLLGNDHHYYGILTNNLAGLKHLDKQYDEALQLYTESSKIFLNRFGEYNTSYATTLNNMAGIYRSVKQYDKSKELYLKVIEIDRSILGEKHPEYAKVINNLGILYSSMGKPELAESLYLKSLELRETNLGVNHPSYAKSLENLGLFYFNQGQYLKSEEYFREALNLRQKQIGSIFPALTEKERIQFYESSREDIERYFSLALLLHHESSLAPYIYNVQLSTKAIIYYASNKMRDAILSSGDRTLIAQYTQWRAMNSRLVRYYQLGENVLRELKIDVSQYEKKVDSLEKTLALRSSVFDNGISQYRPTDWREVKAVLQPGEAAVEIIRMREFDKEEEADASTRYGFTQKVNYIALVLRYDSKEPKIINLENGNAMEKEYFNLFRNSIQYDLRSDHSYKYYWKAIDKELTGIKSVYISPDGIYNKINPNVIYNPNTDNYVIDQMDIHYVTNTKDLIQMKGSRSTSTNRKVELFGNANFSTVSLKNVAALLNMPPLPGTESEVNALEILLQSNGWNPTVHKRMQASEQAVKSVSGPRILHIATHGFFLNETSIIGDNNPLLKSGLLLSNDHSVSAMEHEGDDGVLTAYEAMNLNLENTELVILSACETGLGEVKNGEGIYGLQRSFLVAGAEALILSLFKVNDAATSELMKLFYQYYLQSGDIFSSFKKAQIELRESYGSPLIWGSFIVVGA